MSKSLEAFKLHQKATELLNLSNSSTLVLGEIFYRIQEKKLYKTILGDPQATWSMYCAQPEIGKSKGHISKLISIYKKYIKELKLKYKDITGLDIERLYMIIKVVNKENADEWLARIKTLSRPDLKILLKGVDPATCKHEIEELPAKWRCKICGEIFTTKPE